MANSLYQQLTSQNLSSNQAQTPAVNDQVKQIVHAIKNSSNPMARLSILAQQNPRLNQVIQMINMSGKSPKELFYMYAQQMGVDPNSILNSLNQL